MSDHSSSVNDAPEINADALERWVTDMAEEKAVSEQELLDEVLSSYWVLEELADIIVAHSSEDVELERHDDLPTERTTQSTTDRRNANQNQAPTDQPTSNKNQAPTDRRNTTQTPTDRQNESFDVSSIKHELTELRTAIEQISDDTTPDNTRPDNTQDQSPSADLAELLTEISSLRSAETNQPTRVDKSTEATQSTTTDQSTREPTHDDERLNELENRIQEIEEEFSETLTDTITELEQRISNSKEPASDFQSKINTEFEEIENVLDHLLEATNDMDNRLESVSQTHQAEIEQLQEHRATQNELKELKSDAIKHGVSSASCGSCSQTVDLSLLETLFCPTCDSRFSDITPGSWIPFDTATLHVSSDPPPQTENQP
jgi:Zn finger protein HypA/HybF involved in hydrogenase expression